MSILRRISGSERGGTMLEAVMMLGMVSMMTPYMFKQNTDRQEEIQDVAVANQTRAILSAANAYVEQNYSAIVAGDNLGAGEDFSGGGDEFDISIATLQARGFLPTTVRDGNSFGQTYSVRLKKQDIGGGETRVDALLNATGGDGTLDGVRGNRIAAMVGSGGGYVAVDNNASGAMGAWSADTSTDYGLATSAGDLVATTSYQRNVAMSDGLYRNAIPGFPDANTMGTNLRLASNNINMGEAGNPGSGGNIDMDGGDILNANTIQVVNIDISNNVTIQGQLEVFGISKLHNNFTIYENDTDANATFNVEHDTGDTEIDGTMKLGTAASIDDNYMLDVYSTAAHTRGMRLTTTGIGAEIDTTGASSHGVDVQTAGASAHGANIATTGASGYGVNITTTGTTADGSRIRTTGGSANGINVATTGGTANGALIRTTGANAFGANIGTVGASAHGVFVSTTGASAVGVASNTTGANGHAYSASTLGDDAFGANITTAGLNAHGVNVTTAGDNAFGIRTTTTGANATAGGFNTSGDDAIGVAVTTTGTDAFGVDISTSGIDADGINVATTGANASGVAIDTQGSDAFGLEVNTLGASAVGAAFNTVGSSAVGVSSHTTGTNAHAMMARAEGANAHGILITSEGGNGVDITSSTGNGVNVSASEGGDGVNVNVIDGGDGVYINKTGAGYALNVNAGESYFQDNVFMDDNLTVENNVTISSGNLTVASYVDAQTDIRNTTGELWLNDADGVRVTGDIEIDAGYELYTQGVNTEVLDVSGAIENTAGGDVLVNDDLQVDGQTEINNAGGQALIVNGSSSGGLWDAGFEVNASSMFYGDVGITSGNTLKIGRGSSSNQVTFSQTDLSVTVGDADSTSWNSVIDASQGDFNGQDLTEVNNATFDGSLDVAGLTTVEHIWTTAADLGGETCIHTDTMVSCMPTGDGHALHVVDKTYLEGNVGIGTTASDGIGLTVASGNTTGINASGSNSGVYATSEYNALWGVADHGAVVGQINSTSTLGTSYALYGYNGASNGYDSKYGLYVNKGPAKFNDAVSIGTAAVDGYDLVTGSDMVKFGGEVGIGADANSQYDLYVADNASSGYAIKSEGRVWAVEGFYSRGVGSVGAAGMFADVDEDNKKGIYGLVGGANSYGVYGSATNSSSIGGYFKNSSASGYALQTGTGLVKLSGNVGVGGDAYSNTSLNIASRASGYLMSSGSGKIKFGSGYQDVSMGINAEPGGYEKCTGNIFLCLAGIGWSDRSYDLTLNGRAKFGKGLVVTGDDGWTNDGGAYGLKVDGGSRMDTLYVEEDIDADTVDVTCLVLDGVEYGTCD